MAGMDPGFEPDAFDSASPSQQTLVFLFCKQLFRECCYLHTVSKEINAMVFKIKS